MNHLLDFFRNKSGSCLRAWPASIILIGLYYLSYAGPTTP